MAKLTPAQIKGYAAGAGFSGNDLTVATAVALAESGGNTTSHNATPPDNSYGLMQINMLGSMGPARRKQYALSKNEDLYDPVVNMRVAYGIYKGGGNTFKPWTTFTRGTYKKHMEAASAGLSVPDSGTDPVADTSAAAGATDGGLVTGGLNALGGNIFNAFQNIGGVIIGVVLIIAAVVILAMQSKTAKGVIKKGVKKVL